MNVSLCNIPKCDLNKLVCVCVSVCVQQEIVFIRVYGFISAVCTVGVFATRACL